MVYKSKISRNNWIVHVISALKSFFIEQYRFHGSKKHRFNILNFLGFFFFTNLTYYSSSFLIKINSWKIKHIKIRILTLRAVFLLALQHQCNITVVMYYPDKSFQRYHCEVILWLTYTSSWSWWCFISIIYYPNDGALMM